MAPSFDETINRSGVNLYENWAERLRQASPFPDLNNNPAMDYIGKGVEPLTRGLESIYEHINPQDTSTGIQEYLREQSASRSTDPGLIQKINAFSDSFLNRQNQLLNIGQNGGTSFADGGFNTVQNLAKRLEKLTGKTIFEGLNSATVDELSAEHELLGHLGPKETGFTPDNRRLIYPGGILQEGPFMPPNEVLAQTLNEIQAKGKDGITNPRSKFRNQLDISSLSTNKAMLSTVLDELRNKGIEITEDLNDRINKYHTKVTEPWVVNEALNRFDELGIDDFLEEKLKKPMYRRIKNLSDIQLYDPVSRSSNISLDMPGFPKWDQNAGRLLSRFKDFKTLDLANSRMRNFDHTIKQLKNLYQVANQGSMDNAPGIFDMSGVGNRLLALNPLGAAWEGAKDLLTNKPGVVGHGALSGADSEPSRDAAQTGDWNKVGTHTAFGITKELTIDAAVKAAQQRAAALIQGQTGNAAGIASRFPFISRAGQFLGPAVQKLGPVANAISPHLLPGLVAYDLIKLGQPDSVLTTAVNQAGQAYDRFVESNPSFSAVLPKSNTGWDDPTGRKASQLDFGKQATDAIGKAASEAGNQLKDVAGAAYSQIDTLFGGALRGGVNPRFNGFKATRDLTSAQQLDYRRGGGDAARLQNPGLTPQEVIERGRQAAAAARTQQQNRTSANMTAMGRGSNTGRPANTRPSPSRATQTPIAPSRSRTQPQRRRPGQNPTVQPVVIGGVDVGKVFQGWGNQLFNWNR